MSFWVGAAELHAQQDAKVSMHLDRCLELCHAEISPMQAPLRINTMLIARANQLAFASPSVAIATANPHRYASMATASFKPGHRLSPGFWDDSEQTH